MTWLANVRGNVMVLYALALIPIVGVAGFAMDMNRQKTVQIRIQAALDTAVLTVARESVNSDLDKDALEAMAQKIFNEAMTGTGSITLGDPVLTETDGVYSLTVSGSMPTAVMGVLGKPTMPIGNRASAAASAPNKLEMALVLDNSGSMDGSKITALKSAATQLVTDLVQPGSEDVKVSIVPFNNYVNVGMHNRNASWISVPPDEPAHGGYCPIDTAASEAAGCALTPSTCYDDDDDSYSCDRWVCPSGVDVVYDCTGYSQVLGWHGCVSSRQSPFNVEDRNYTAHKVPAFRNTTDWDCPEPITPLTGDLTTLTTAIDAMYARSSTYIATGLTWGLRALTPGEPFSEGALFELPVCPTGSDGSDGTCNPDPSGTNPTGTAYHGIDQFVQDGGVRVLVLMSDGANTRSAQYWSGGQDHWGTDVAAANLVTEDVCDEIKGYDIELYTIAFEVTDADLKDLLRGCASSPDHFFDAGNTASLLASFSKIGKAYSPIALVE